MYWYLKQRITQDAKHWCLEFRIKVGCTLPCTTSATLCGPWGGWACPVPSDRWTDSLPKAKEAWGLPQLPCWMQWFLHRDDQLTVICCHVSAAAITLTTQAPFHWAARWGGSLSLGKHPLDGWVTLRPLLPPKLRGNLQDEASSTPLLVTLLFLLLLSSHNLAQRRADVLILPPAYFSLKWLARQMFQ